MTDDPNVKKPGPPLGLFIRGTLLGRQGPRTFDRPDGETVKVKPKFGLKAGPIEYSVKGTDDDQIDAALVGKIKGDVVEILIEAVAPYGAGGKPVDYTLPGVIQSRQESWR